MAVERDEGWKGGGRTMSRQAIDYGVWLADFAILFLKAWQDSVLGFFKSSSRPYLAYSCFFPMLSLLLKHHQRTNNLIFCEVSPSSY